VVISLYSNNWLVLITETCLLRGTNYIFNTIHVHLNLWPAKQWATFCPCPVQVSPPEMSDFSGLKHGRETSYPNWIFRYLRPSLQANAQTGFISSLTFPSQQFARHYSQTTLPPTLFTKSLNKTKTILCTDTTVSSVPVLHTAVNIWCELLCMCWLSVCWQCLYCLLGYVTTKAYRKRYEQASFIRRLVANFF